MGTIFPLFDKETGQRDRTESQFLKAAGHHYSISVQICIYDFPGDKGMKKLIVDAIV
jgi:hypothetical protein